MRRALATTVNTYFDCSEVTQEHVPLHAQGYLCHFWQGFLGIPLICADDKEAF